MAEPAVLGRAMPVLYTSGNIDHAAWMECLGLPAPFLIPAAAVSAEQDLPAAFGRMVNMPVVAAPWFKGDIRKENSFLGIGEGLR